MLLLSHLLEEEKKRSLEEGIFDLLRNTLTSRLVWSSSFLMTFRRAFCRRSISATWGAIFITCNYIRIPLPLT